MRRTARLVGIAVALCLVPTLVLNAAREAPVAETSVGKVQLMSAGQLTFGPSGVLFVGDSTGGSIVAIETGDMKASASAAGIDIQGIDQKVAALLGTAADQVMINDVTVNPTSKNVYLSVSRGRGPDAAAVIVRADNSGQLSVVSLDNVKHTTVSLSDAPASNTAARQNPRTQTITDMQYVNGNLVIAGLSNEEWSSALRSIPYPFKQAERGTTLQIWHASHGQYETASPVRTFVPYTIEGKQYILAAYTCTPLVKIPVSDLKPGAKVKGVTIADLGSGNQPLDMVPYAKDGHNYILVANSSHGTMKLKADNLETYKPIESPTVVDVAGVPFDRIPAIKSVRHLAQYDASHALVLTSAPANLQTVALP
jgi:hypothetical protein